MPLANRTIKNQVGLCVKPDVNACAKLPTMQSKTECFLTSLLAGRICVKPVDLLSISINDWLTVAKCRSVKKLWFMTFHIFDSQILNRKTEKTNFRYYRFYFSVLSKPTSVSVSILSKYRDIGSVFGIPTQDCMQQEEVTLLSSLSITIYS
jgi:hypothetical protein